MVVNTFMLEFTFPILNSNSSGKLVSLKTRLRYENLTLEIYHIRELFKRTSNRKSFERLQSIENFCIQTK